MTRIARLTFKKTAAFPEMQRTFDEIRADGLKVTQAWAYWDIWP